MFIYLSKKIAIPNNTKLNCLAWNKEQGYIAVGGSDGLLKILKLDSGNDNKMKGLAAPSNLSMNQTLEGHSGEVQVIVWNEIYQKLTTSDQYGLIIVWMLYKGSWYEEMINNRNKSVVKGMSWSSDGQKICITYEDGAVIVGSVDGNRIWGKEIKGAKLSAVQWAPHVKLNIHLSPVVASRTKTIVGLDWYDGKQGLIDEHCPVLALCYHSGHMQLMKNEYDENPVVIDTNMKAVCCKWNHNGTVIAVVGTMILPNEHKENNVIQFFNPYGEHIRTLKVPGENVTSCEWEGNSLRVALSVDSHIYFANIRPDYKWTSLNNGRIIVYSYNSLNQQGTCICFWDTKKGETHIKHFSGLLGITGYSMYCVAAFRTDDPKIFKIMLFNSIATLIDTKDIEIEPLWLAINSSAVFIASKNNFAIWSFKAHEVHSSVNLVHKKIKIYHIDDIPCGVADVIQDLDVNYEPVKDTFATSDPICCITASDKILLIARESGVIQHYTLPHIALTLRYSVHNRLYSMFINCDSTKCALIDVSGILTFRNIEESNEFTLKSHTVTNQNPTTERKDVWALCWASDNPSLLATMEKTRMYILRNDEPEEPIISAGYICSFKDLEIRGVLLDEIMKNPEQPSPEHILDLEVKSLRDTRELLDKVGITEAPAFIEDNSHPILWKLLAESALKKMDLTIAESAFVRFSDIQGLQFVKRLQNIHSESLRKAEIASYLGNFDEAEKIYLEIDRADLAVQLRERLGDWFRVAQLMKIGVAGSDIQYEKTYNSIGDYFVDRQNWKSAQEYYEKSRNFEKEAMCAYMLEDWESLKAISRKLNEKHPFLVKLGTMLANVGICKEAVDVFVKAGEIKKAVDCCITLSQWSEAIRLAVKHQYPGVSKLLASSAKQLIESGKILEAIDFLSKAQQYIEAAKLMFMVADDEAKKTKDLVYIKKLYVLAALILEEKQKTKIGELSTILEGETTTDLLEPWRKAEAYHFLILAEKQLQQGYIDSAMRTSLILNNYEDILDPEEIYCLQAITSAGTHYFAICSKSLSRLEALPDLPEDKKTEYEALALDLFSRNCPRDPKENLVECSICLTLISSLFDTCPNCKTKFPVCVITGIPILNDSNIWTCTTCHHKAVAHDAAIRKTCALCHAST
ncbi:WD-repeat protein, putative [Pediculus humanus corporis]|uniref:WD-repeat protein, putative n=1 Tax=Pediculus humanus subsp. corporis TaxID=121224 RepID=E0VC29_PEDHC|nr:WD-repeat protein, putative [Pediculus humanus corporis]EEB10935.1 WD-repeat protein, putative [Pediculus humanus corporis]